MKKMTEYLMENKINEKIYFISDTHFGDERLNLYGRDLVFKNSKVFELKIIENWNNVVNKNDLVIVVGDVAFSEENLTILNRLNGKKWLVKGNYDISKEFGGTAKFKISDDLLKKYFEKVVDDMTIKIGDEDVYINHFPTNAKINMFNIVGHIHGTWKVQRNMINVGCDAWHFTPISEDMIKFQMNGIRKHYDQNVFAGELVANIEHKKGEFKVLRAPEYNPSLSNNSYVIFLMGPIQGATEWHESLIGKLEKEFENSEKNIIVASPKRLEKTKDFKYAEQVDWESYYLEEAAKNGIIFCWLANEKEKIEGRTYAQTSRFEIGEWWVKSNGSNIIIGADSKFDGIKYIDYKFKQNHPDFKLYDNLDDMIKKLKNILKNDKI
jgi:calcineurin-like phosphoesterase family protein